MAAHYFRGFDTVPLRYIYTGPDPRDPTGVGLLKDRTFDQQRLQIFAVEADCKCGPLRPFVGAAFFRTPSFDELDASASLVSEVSWVSAALGLEARFDGLTRWLDVRLKAQFRVEAQVLLYPVFHLDFAAPNVVGRPPDAVINGHLLATGPDFQLELLFFSRVRLSGAAQFTPFGGQGNFVSVFLGYEPLPGLRLSVGTEHLWGIPGTRFTNLQQTGRFFLRARYEIGR